VLRPIFAATIVLGWGCGDGGGQARDAGEPDASPDATAIGAVGVTTLVRCCGGAPGQGQPDVEVMSHDADGALRDRAQSDAAGTATVEVEDGGSVSVIYREGQRPVRTIVTIAGVAPGDQLTFGDTFRPPFANVEIGQMTVSWPEVAGAASYAVYSVCGPTILGDVVTTPLVQFDHCVTASTDVLVVARDGGGALVGYAFAADVAWQAGGAISFDAVAAPATLALAVTGLPPEVSDYRVNAFPIVDTALGPGGALGGAPANGSVTATTPWPVTQHGTRARTTIRRAGAPGEQSIVERLAPDADLVVDDPALLPWIERGEVSLADRLVTWTEVGGGAADASVALVYWEDELVAGEWKIVGPPGAGAARIPRLPDDLAALGPGPGDPVDGVVVVFESDAWADYREVRQSPEWLIERPYLVPFDAATVPRVRSSGAPISP
jgi:hypothetical protein